MDDEIKDDEILEQDASEQLEESAEVLGTLTTSP